MPTPLVVISVLFVVGYLCIILEHNTGIDKAAAAVLTGVLCWTVYVMAAPSLIDTASLPAEFLASQGGKDPALIARTWVGEHRLLEHFAGIASILFFLLGAMTIVEMVDTYGGFTVITDRIRSTSLVTGTRATSARSQCLATLPARPCSS